MGQNFGVCGKLRAAATLLLLACSDAETSGAASPERTAPEAGPAAERGGVVAGSDAGSGRATDAGAAHDAQIEPVRPPLMRDAGRAVSPSPAADGGERDPEQDEDAGPVKPVGGPWFPPADRIPVGSNYVYLEGDPGDVVTKDRSYLYTDSDAALQFWSSAETQEFTIYVQGDESWAGKFTGSADGSRLERAYFPNATTAPNERPGVYWHNERERCEAQTGWLAVDHIVYSREGVLELDLRFEQHCDGAAAATRGAAHFRQYQRVQAPGPVVPAPADLWRPTLMVPAGSGNYVILQRNNEAPALLGKDAHTPKLDGSSGTTSPADIRIVDTQNNLNNARFEAMRDLSAFVPGYYGNVQTKFMHNPVRAGFTWRYGTADCEGTGWFVIDHIVYGINDIDELDLRFERTCADQGVLHGQVHIGL